MRSTTRRCGVYGREYALTRLHLFAWWKKNGKKRLQKASSSFAQIRSRPTVRSCSFYRRPNLRCKTNFTEQASHRSNWSQRRHDGIAQPLASWAGATRGRTRQSPKANAWPRGWASQRWLLDSIQRWSKSRAWPPHCAALLFFFFIYFC
jgi:hypothetical protein